jgi:HEAT repeat protein
LKNICCNQDSARAKAFQAKAVPALIGLLSHNDIKVQADAASALWKVCLHEPAAQAAQQENVVPTLVRLMGCSDAALQKSAVDAMYGVTNESSSREARLSAIHLGAIPALITLLNSNNVDVYENAAATVQNLTNIPEADEM